MSHHPAVFKHCSVCDKEFKQKQRSQNICSWECRIIATREKSRENMRKRRHSKDRYFPCYICGYKLTTDGHHEGNKVYPLCPNHHALITRSIRTFKELLEEKKKLCI